MSLSCPSCKSPVFEPDVKCEVCAFPLKGTEKEKAVFIGKKYANKQKKADARQAINRNKAMLFILGGFNIVVPFFKFILARGNFFDLIWGFIVGGFFIGLGFLAKVQPLVSFILALSFLLFGYLVEFLINPSSIFNGLIIKIVIIGVLVYGIIRAVELQKAKNA